MSRLIVGLGNPGGRYARNRHNVGFQCLDYIARKHAVSFGRRQARAHVATGAIGGARVILAKPQTYMNLSGPSVRELASFYKIAPSDLLVIYDDLDLPLGTIRIRPGGSSGGHKGMESIIQSLHTQDFPRLRIGIDRPFEGDTIPYVLQDFTPEERRELEEIYSRAADAVECLLTEGIDQAMNKFNRS